MAFSDYLKIMKENGYIWSKENVVFILELEEAGIMGRASAIVKKL